MLEIGNFNLKNQSTAVVKLQFVYFDDAGNKIHLDGTDGFPPGQSRTADPGDYGVPDGARVALYVFVVWGVNNEAEETFLYRQGNPRTAYYTVGGLQSDNALKHLGIQ